MEIYIGSFKNDYRNGKGEITVYAHKRIKEVPEENLNMEEKTQDTGKEKI